jgi:hypothetical protein
MASRLTTYLSVFLSANWLLPRDKPPSYPLSAAVLPTCSLPAILPVCLSFCLLTSACHPIFLSAGPYSSHQFQYLVWLLLSCLPMPAYPCLPAALLLFCLSVMAPVCLFVILSAASDLSAPLLDCWLLSACLRLIDQTYLLFLLGGQL